jgi:acyl-CoA synthetase (AMP-forming)/AMP-acid ligase II
MSGGKGAARKSAPGEIWRAFAAVAEASPRRRVIESVEGGEAWTARELLARARLLGDEAELARARDGCVAFSLPTSPAWMAAFLATQSAGVAALPIDRASAVRDWREEAAELGATHALDGARLVSLGRGARAMAWGRFAAAKVTSGSTGAPTVIPCRASNLLADGWNIIRTMKIRPRDRNLAILPLGHSYGLGNLVMPLVLQGTGLVTAASYVPRQVLEWIEARRISVLPAVPVVLQILAGIEGDYDLRALRLVISAGAPLPAETAREFFRRFRRKVRNFYGSSETGGICFDASGAASRTGRSVGRPLDGVTVRVTAGGRIAVSSEAVAMPRGRCTLADVGRWTADGELEITGRATPVANIGGRKVNPREIETALRTIPGVTAAWVAVTRGADRDSLVAAVESARSKRAIVEDLAALVAAWKRPRRVVVASILPRTVRGKLDAAALRAWFD